MRRQGNRIENQRNRLTELLDNENIKHKLMKKCRIIFRERKDKIQILGRGMGNVEKKQMGNFILFFYKWEILD